jgi:adk: adenylate kinases
MVMYWMVFQEQFLRQSA